MVELGCVAQCDVACDVDFVRSDSPVAVVVVLRLCFGSGGVFLVGCCSAEGAVGSFMVVILGEFIELVLEYF